MAIGIKYTVLAGKIKDILKTVTGVPDDNIYIRNRFIKDEKEFITAFVASNKLHGYVIYREGFPQEDRTTTSTTKRHSFVIIGFMAYKDTDTSEQDYQDLIDAIDDAFRADRTLGDNIHWVEPMQMRSFSIASFHSVLCYRAELSLVLNEDIQWR